MHTVAGFVKARSLKVDDDYTVLLLHEKTGFFDLYVKRRYEDSETPYMFMFGLPDWQQSWQEAIDTAVANIDRYSFLFDDNDSEYQEHECYRCGTKLLKHSNFCHICGAVNL